jgi:hypothetical protein
MDLFKWRKVMFLGKDVSTVRKALIEQFHQLKGIESEIATLKGVANEAKSQPESPVLYMHYVQASNTLLSHISAANDYCQTTRLSPIPVPSKLDIKTIDDMKTKVHTQLTKCELTLAALR